MYYLGLINKYYLSNDLLLITNKYYLLYITYIIFYIFFSLEKNLKAKPRDE